MTRLATLVRKDFRHFWPQVAIFWVLLPIGIDLSETTFPQAGLGNFWLRGSISQELLLIAAPLACWALAIAAVHHETLVGDRQYWLTRPFGRVELAASKALFFLLAINVPLFLFQSIGLAIHGLSPAGYACDLFWRQVFFTVYFILVPAAVAAVTRTIFSSVTTLLAICVSPLAWVVFTSHGQLLQQFFTWVHYCALAAAAAAGALIVLAVEYAWRRTLLARSLLVVAVIAAILSPLFVSTEAAFALQGRFSTVAVPADAFRIELDPTRQPYWGGQPPIPNVLSLWVPLVLANPPRDSRIEPWFTDVRGRSGTVNCDLGRLWLRVSLQRNDIGRTTFDLDGTVSFILLSERGHVDLPPSEAVIHLPGVGVCDSRREAAHCYSPHLRAALAESAQDRRWYTVSPWEASAPFPTSPWINPLDVYPWHATDPVLSRLTKRSQSSMCVTVLQPVAWFTRDFSFHNLHPANSPVRSQ